MKTRFADKMETDVVIVGAGPAGATVGRQIANAGFDVLIIEKDISPGKKKVCGGVMSKQCFTELDLPKEIIEKESFKLVLHIQNEKYEVPSKSGNVLFKRERLDKLMALKAMKNGAKLLTSTLVSDAFRHDGKIVLHLRRLPQGTRSEVKTRLAVFADGTSTIAQEKFGVGFQRKPDCTAVAAATELRRQNNPLDSLEFFVADQVSPFGYGWIFPKKNSINVGVICSLSRIKQDIRKYLENFMISQGINRQKTIKFGFRLVPQSPAEKVQSDSVLIVGDAAGTADPLTGAGISNAIINAKIAANVAIRALSEKKTNEESLSEYESKWKETSNYLSLVNSHRLQKVALESGINYGFFVKMMALQ